MAGSSTEAKFDLSVPDLEKMAKQLRRHVIKMIATADRKSTRLNSSHT